MAKKVKFRISSAMALPRIYKNTALKYININIFTSRYRNSLSRSVTRFYTDFSSLGSDIKHNMIIFVSLKIRNDNTNTFIEKMMTHQSPYLHR